MELELSKNTIKEIESGKYHEYYLIYNRKSTDDAENQQNSISYQKSENMRLVLRDKLRIAPISLKGFCLEGMVTEKHSAFKTNEAITLTKNGQVQFAMERPKFQQLMYFLSKGFFKGIVVLSWDRASRNSRDEMIIRELMDRGIDFRFVNAKYDKSSAGELHKDIDAMVSKHRSRDTREKVLFTFRKLREDGVVTNRAPVGYLNQGDMYNKPFDPVRAPIIKDMFEMHIPNWVENNIPFSSKKNCDIVERIWALYKANLGKVEYVFVNAWHDRSKPTESEDLYHWEGNKKAEEAAESAL
jgi:DNA invertase Pin-like site-specific DNA recombinase